MKDTLAAKVQEQWMNNEQLAIKGKPRVDVIGRRADYILDLQLTTI